MLNIIDDLKYFNILGEGKCSENPFGKLELIIPHPNVAQPKVLALS